MNPSCIARQLDISGVVQGVGFRPFLFALAREHRIAGEVSNTAQGVLARVEGTPDDLDRFITGITARQPRLARVDNIEATPAAVNGATEFSIVPSRGTDTRTALISPDVCVCDDCLAEMQDPDNRRFGYPFINCTHCGPRFTIITDIPYDRPNTAMKVFTMCPDCRAEYENPADRRFHAQPNACPVCGPRVCLTDNQGIRLDDGPGHALDLAADLLKKGKILAVKGLGGFHLAVDAANDRAVTQLRERKQRPHKPFALMARSGSVLFDHVRMSEQELGLLTSFNRPIVLLEKIRADSHAGLSPALAPANTCLGVMLPYTPLHFLLLEKGPDILVMTSGNRSGQPLAIDNQEALDAFSHIADYFLLHDRDIYFRADDSLARIQAGRPRFVRRSRGYVPLPISLAKDFPPILGCGAGMKNTICLTRGSQAFVSQHIGDLENQETFEFFTRTIDHFRQILSVTPVAVAHDLHPGYMSTVWAISNAGQKTLPPAVGTEPDPPGMGESLPPKPDATCIRESLTPVTKAPGNGESFLVRAAVPRLGVQHHHAHAVSCMAENHLEGPVVAVVLDGTGYGTDGRIWGGEVLTADHGTFERHAHLRYLALPGGDQAVKEPWRMAASVLFAAWGPEFLDLDIPFVRQVDREKLAFVCRMMEKQLNSPLTSSCGRLFDAVSALLGIRHAVSYDSQAAMELESAAAAAPDFTAAPAASDAAPVSPDAPEQSAASAASNASVAGTEYKPTPPQPCLPPDTPYRFDLSRTGFHGSDPTRSGPVIIDLIPGIREIVTDIRAGTPAGTIARRFHVTLVAAFAAAAHQVAAGQGLDRVVLSGGVFHNEYLLIGMIQALEASGLTVFTHTRVPPGDGGIALGQAVAAAAMLARHQELLKTARLETGKT
jgi:hydrogenase maturation protein HypF